jgi:hypothetical protein
MKMTHSRGRTKKQYGGMKFAHEVLEYLIKRGVEHNEEYNDLNVMKFLIENASGLRIVWDASTYSFIFELTFHHGLIDPYGLPLGESVATRDAHTAHTAAAAAGIPEPGTRVSTFCAKISCVNSTKIIKKYKKITKVSVTSDNANREAETQRGLFEAFACRRTTAPFVPDVIAHAILTGAQFRAIFANILSSNVASTTPDVLGTPKEIYDWIDAWITSNGIMVDVVLMEMMDFQRTAPSVARSQPFAMIHRLRSQSQANHQQAALRMMANIASVRGKGIMPHDFHEGNGLATADGLQLYLIDWGGLFNLNIPADRHRLLSIFERMCSQSRTTDADASKDAMKEVTAATATGATGADLVKIKRLARFPSLEELCVFFQIVFHDNTVPDYRIKNLHNLKVAFQPRLMAFVDFTCEPPTPANVHSALMMVAFVDFMANRMEFNYPYCQCGGVLKVVYPDQAGQKTTSTSIDLNAFEDFRLFLKTFKFVNIPSNTRLPEVVAMIEENVRLCHSACGGVPLDKTHLRANSWINVEIKKRRLAAAEARRLAEQARRLAEKEEARRLAAEAEEAEEARRLAAEAEEAKAAEAKAADAQKVAEAKAEAKNKAAEAKEAASRMRLENMGRPKGVAKPNKTLSKPDANQKVKAALQAPQSAQSAAQAVDASAASFQVAVPTSWLARVSSKLNPRNWYLPLSWKRKGGTRKQHKQRKSFTKRRHN